MPAVRREHRKPLPQRENAARSRRILPIAEGRNNHPLIAAIHLMKKAAIPVFRQPHFELNRIGFAVRPDTVIHPSCDNTVARQRRRFRFGSRAHPGDSDAGKGGWRQTGTGILRRRLRRENCCQGHRAQEKPQ